MAELTEDSETLYPVSNRIDAERTIEGVCWYNSGLILPELGSFKQNKNELTIVEVELKC